MIGDLFSGWFRPAKKVGKCVPALAHAELYMWEFVLLGLTTKEIPNFVEQLQAYKEELFSWYM